MYHFTSKGVTILLHYDTAAQYILPTLIYMKLKTDHNGHRIIIVMIMSQIVTFLSFQFDELCFVTLAIPVGVMPRIEQHLKIWD